MTEPFDHADPDRAHTHRPDLLIRTPPRRVSGLRRRTVRLAIALLAVVVAVAVMFGLGIDFHPHHVTDSKVEPPSETLQPSPIADLPSSYAEVPRPVTTPPQSQSAMQDMHGMQHDQTGMPMNMTTQSQNDELAHLLASIQQIGNKNQELAQQIASYQAQAAQEQAKVWGSSLFFKMDQVPDREEEPPKDAEQQGATTVAEEKNAANAGAVGTAASLPPSSPPQPTDQQRKLAFLHESPAPPMDVERSALSSAPRDTGVNGYLLQAGTVVSAALLTGINTDLPGDVVATITQGVYDSPTGDHLLIPQGARLYGSYDSQVSPSQNRALLVWHRLLLPDGQSMNLDRMRGTDAAGYAGLADQVDYHLDKLTTAALLSGVIAYAANLAGGRQQTLTLTPGDVVGDAIAQQASTVGSNIVQRQLNVQPIITIRPGWPVRVLVNRDFLLPAYTN